MTTEEVAKLCRTSAGTVRYWRHHGTGPRGLQVGKRTLYAKSEVHSWLESKVLQEAEAG
ncbi:helix-turn-helix domain-containing protein [Aeromicrobium sp. Root495]|uniref:helix-turn-helix domain-containing protein n=1 Tax=Aeromicrobium sp. Root495 TaxID=1736550 RepID=UPI003FA449FC